MKKLTAKKALDEITFAQEELATILAGVMNPGLGADPLPAAAERHVRNALTNLSRARRILDGTAILVEG